MVDAPYIPKKTAEEMGAPEAPGGRHAQMIRIALSLLGNGMTDEAIFAQLRATYPEDKTDKEIRDVISWSREKNPQPSGNAPATPRSAQPRQALAKVVPASAAVRIFVGQSEPALSGSVEIPETGHAELLLRSLYQPGEFLNIVCRFTTVGRNGKTKCNPDGGGKILTRDQWLEYFTTRGIPMSDAGAWFRPNPTLTGRGSGKDGAPTNADVSAFRFLLIESDKLSLDEQLAFYGKSGLPISAVITSGGDSAHAWLRIDAEDAEDYADKAVRIYAALERFGFDKANKNPSRLSRLPGATRKIGASNGGAQRLLYLRPEAEPITDEQIDALALRLTPAKFNAVPMATAMYDAIAHYEELHRNKSATGLRTGFPRFDAMTGGLKPGWLVIVAGETNSGKTSYVLNIVINALMAGIGVALFSFEMDLQEVIDIIFSREAQVSRNKFNNAFFSSEDFVQMSRVCTRAGNWPLYCFDDPLMTISDVMSTAEHTKAEHGIGLVVIDYLQLANSESYRDSREQQVAHVSRMSKAMAKKLKVPVIGISQLNEDGKVRESRGIAHDANVVLKLTENENGTVEGRVIKGRSIPKGSFYFQFDREFCEFTETGCDEHLTKLLPREQP